MMDCKRIIEDIKSVKIQGAENIALHGVKALICYAKKIKEDGDFERKILKFKGVVENARPTEPLLRNCIDYIFHAIPLNLYELEKRAEFVIKHMKSAIKKIEEYGSRKIENGMIVFTHCHSSAVMSILKRAWEEGKQFEVYNTETRPLFQGRRTAKELAELGIKVTHFVDAAARVAIKDADIMLIGCDAITAEGKVINKIGSEMFAIIANKYEVPVYSATDSWKFDPKTVFGYKEPIEMRNPAEIWKNAPNNVEIRNLAFERIDPNLITAIISELGIYSVDAFILEVKKKYRWL
ncbi:MAG: hypothetical protein DRP03_03490 [Candidatus Aenigmatarchaeota archaeon]|nr:MAG: hypothetical protein DRP03_03490 [Candidatus Aenigmarchaeota archaeon]